MLELIEVNVGVGGAASTVLLRGVSLHVSEGERLAVVGPSGAGKTTLLRIIAGLADPVVGRVRLDGRSGDEVGWPAWRRQVTYVSQQPVMTAGTVRANLRRPFHYRRHAAPFDEDRSVAWLGRLGLAESVVEQQARTLSVGQQQRVSLVRALGIGPRVLLLDEPTGALDPDAVEALETLVTAWTERGGAALIVTHDREQAARWCTATLDLRPNMVAPQGAGGSTPPREVAHG